jgi:acetylornithine deacetylase
VTASSPAAAIDRWIDAHADDLIDLARELVRIPTENHPPTGDELAGQEFMRDRLRDLGAEIDWFTPDDVPGLREHPAYFPLINGRPREFVGRPNVVGTFRGGGGGRSVLFSTHMDTVPSGDAPWTTGTPFGGEIRDGKLYGRGSYDTKCAHASHLIAVRCLRDLGIPLRGDVIVESVVDEEYGGSHGVLASRLRGYNADIAFNSEPTHMVVCPAHRGGREAYLRFAGDAGMAYGGETQTDPVLALGRAIVAIKEFDRERNRTADVPVWYRGEPHLPFYLNQVGGGGDTYEEAVGTPGETYLHFWAEVYEGTTAQEFDTALLERVERALRADPDVASVRPDLVPTIRFLPGSSMPGDHSALGVLEEAYAELGTRPFALRGAPFACDAYIFNLFSPTPALVLGPGGGGAHAPDEHVLIDDLVDLSKIEARFIHRWCG